MTKTPFRVTLLLVLVLSLTAWNILRLWTALAWNATLSEVAGAQIVRITTISAAVWICVGVFTAWIVMQRKTWAAKVVIPAAIAYTSWYWFERLLWENPRPNWMFVVIVNLGLLVFTLFSTKLISREAYERKIENPTPE